MQKIVFEATFESHFVNFIKYYEKIYVLSIHVNGERKKISLFDCNFCFFFLNALKIKNKKRYEVFTLKYNSSNVISHLNVARLLFFTKRRRDI